MKRLFWCGLGWWAGVVACSGAVESARTIPLAQDVDVVVVGGASGAVAAALKARESGARVFLVAPRPYLGEDMAGKLRLRLEADDDARSALLKPMFTAPETRPPSLPFTYRTDAKPDPRHLDSSGNKLSDGKWQDAPNDSVQFNHDVAYALDLGNASDIALVMLGFFRRVGETGFNTEALIVEGSLDAETWTRLGEVRDRVDGAPEESASLALPVQGRWRHLRLTAKLDPTYPRQLLSEFYVYQSAPPAVKGDETTPLRVKRTLDQALLAAGIPFLTGAVATEPLLDAAGKLSGVAIANRSGRQAIKARVVIDATERGWLARAAGAEATPFPAGTHTFRRRVVAGEAPRGEGVRTRELFGVFNARVTGVKPPPGMPELIEGRLYESEIDLPMKDGSARSFAEAEQRARDLTFVPTQLDSSDTLFLVPPDHFKGRASSQAPWAGVDKLDVAWFQPAGVDYLFVLGPLGDISRQAAEALMKPGNLMAWGERVGVAAAAAAASRGAVGNVRVPGGGAAPQANVTVLEHQRNLPPYLTNTTGEVPVEPRELPVLAECDVMVAGAGTGGGPAGIAAARQGMRTIVCDYLYQMGGVQTEGLIGRYWFGNRVGFTAEIDEGVQRTGAVLVQSKSEWYRRENRIAGAEVWYGTMVTGVALEGDRLTGVVVVMPCGQRGVIRCRVAIDATGNAELPALAGEETEFITADELALQGVGQTPRNLGASYTNTDFCFVDDTDAASLFFFALRSRLSMRENTWDQSQVINSRERRRLRGVFYITPLDVANQRTYPDVVVQTYSNFDTHGHTVHEQFFIEDPGRHGIMVNLPYRSMLPRRVDGLLVIGLGLSAHRDAMPILRMQPDVQNQGYAAGVAAAMSIKANVAARAINIPTLQRHLIERRILPPDALAWKDSFPLSDAAFAQAVAAIPQDYQGLGVVLTDYQRSVPLLREAFRQASVPEARFKYAHVLAMMGHGDGEDLLIERVRSMGWDQGWNFRGMGQFNRSVSWVDSYIIALGRARSRKAVPAILDKARVLTAADEFSHFRAVALALEAIGDRSAAPVLAEALSREGIMGHAIVMGPDIPRVPSYSDVEGDRERTRVLRELALARALYRLGDHNGLGAKTLRSYAQDPRGAYATHASLALATW